MGRGEISELLLLDHLGNSSSKVLGLGCVDFLADSLLHGVLERRTDAGLLDGGLGQFIEKRMFFAATNRCYNKFKQYLSAVVVVQLVEPSLPTTEVSNSNTVIAKFILLRYILSTVLKR